MPAVDVADRLALPRIVGPGGPGVVDRPVVSVTTAPEGLEGEGFPVHRAFAGVPHQCSTVRAHGPDGRGGLRPG